MSCLIFGQNLRLKVKQPSCFRVDPESSNQHFHTLIFESITNFPYLEQKVMAQGPLNSSEDIQL